MFVTITASYALPGRPCGLGATDGTHGTRTWLTGHAHGDCGTLEFTLVTIHYHGIHTRYALWRTVPHSGDIRASVPLNFER